MSYTTAPPRPVTPPAMQPRPVTDYAFGPLAVKPVAGKPGVAEVTITGAVSVEMDAALLLAAFEAARARIDLLGVYVQAHGLAAAEEVDAALAAVVAERERAEQQLAEVVRLYAPDLFRQTAEIAGLVEQYRKAVGGT